jgi:hypothetical protein
MEYHLEFGQNMARILAGILAIFQIFPTKNGGERMQKKRVVVCRNCGHQWKSNSEQARCSRCGSRNVEDALNTTTAEAVKLKEPRPNGLDYAKVYDAFDNGMREIEIVKMGLCTPEQARALLMGYEDLKNEHEPLIKQRVKMLEEQLTALQHFTLKLNSIVKNLEDLTIALSRAWRGER